MRHEKRVIFRAILPKSKPTVCRAGAGSICKDCELLSSAVEATFFAPKYLKSRKVENALAQFFFICGNVYFENSLRRYVDGKHDLRPSGHVIC